MNIAKKDVNKAFVIFLFSHFLIWVLVPAISNQNLPLDTIEALAWGSNLDWGFNKHPPLSAFAVEVFYQIFGNQDWAYYFLSQLFVISTFIIIFKFSEDFFENKIHSLISVLLLEGVFFYNFTTPEFNVNVCQLPFWALSVYYCWRGLQKNDILSWLLFGLFAGLGVLSKYLFVYLLIAIDIFFIYLIIKKKFNFKCLISLISFFVVLLPHIIWLMDNNYTTITYALHRTGVGESDFFTSHILLPFIFLGKQVVILLPFFIMTLLIISKLKVKINFRDKKLIFLLFINIIPIFLIFLTSLFMGVKIRTMWMTPFYLFIGVLVVYLFKKKITVKKLKYFFSIFLTFFILSPAIYFYISITKLDKRTDYPGKEISYIEQSKWDDNFTNKIRVVGGDEWHGGNLSYHLKDRPAWDNIFENKIEFSLKNNDGFILIGDSITLSKICTGVFVEVKTKGVCMIGKKK
jgi:4-amino-4-deoxy-L-arabinose transferase-like glycosyltransferase